MKKGLISHIEINVKNLKSTYAFWSWLLQGLGYIEHQNWDNGFSYILKSTYIVFVKTEEKYTDIGFHRKRSGLNHLAFHLDSITELKYYENLLKKKNIPILYPDKYPNSNYSAIFFEDPNRIKVELVFSD